MTALALAAISGVSWGVSDFIAGLAARRTRVLVVLWVSQAVGLLLSALVLVVTSPPRPPTDDLAFAALSSVAGIGGLAAFYRGLAVGAMSLVAPLSAAGAALPVAVGIARGEHPGVLQLVGVLAVLVGAALASLERDQRGSAARLARGVPYALLAALGFGLFFVAMDGAADRSPSWALAANRVTGVTILTVAMVVARPSLPSGGVRTLAPLILIGFLDTAANLLYAIASRIGLLSLGAALASLYPVVVVLLARFFLAERLRRAQFVGVVATLAGVALVTAAR